MLKDLENIKLPIFNKKILLAKKPLFNKTPISFFCGG